MTIYEIWHSGCVVMEGEIGVGQLGWGQGWTFRDALKEHFSRNIDDEDYDQMSLTYYGCQCYPSRREAEARMLIDED